MCCIESTFINIFFASSFTLFLVVTTVFTIFCSRIDCRVAAMGGSFTIKMPRRVLYVGWTQCLSDASCWVGVTACDQTEWFQFSDASTWNSRVRVTLPHGCMCVLVPTCVALPKVDSTRLLCRVNQGSTHYLAVISWFSHSIWMHLCRCFVDFRFPHGANSQGEAAAAVAADNDDDVSIMWHQLESWRAVTVGAVGETAKRLSED